MRFMMLVKGNSDYEAGKPPSPELMEAIGALAEKGFRDGTLIEQGGLLPSSAGARIRVKDSKVRVIDGPFAEARELIGGYAVIEAPSKAEAVRIGVRALPADGKPAIGPIGGLAGYYVAVTHSGVTLAPFLGQLITEEILSGKERNELAAFRPDRFHQENAPAAVAWRED